MNYIKTTAIRPLFTIPNHNSRMKRNSIVCSIGELSGRHQDVLEFFEIKKVITLHKTLLELVKNYQYCYLINNFCVNVNLLTYYT